MAGAIRKILSKLRRRPKSPVTPPRGYRGVAAGSLKPGKIRPGAIEEVGKGENLSWDEGTSFLEHRAVLPVSSSNVEAMQYDGETKELIVKFLNGQHYKYSSINKPEAEEFLMAMSKGGVVWDRLRVRGSKTGHRKPYQKVGGFKPVLTPAQVDEYFAKTRREPTEDEIVESFVSQMLE